MMDETDRYRFINDKQQHITRSILVYNRLLERLFRIACATRSSRGNWFLSHLV